MDFGKPGLPPAGSNRLTPAQETRFFYRVSQFGKIDYAPCRPIGVTQRGLTNATSNSGPIGTFQNTNRYTWQSCLRSDPGKSNPIQRTHGVPAPGSVANTVYTAGEFDQFPVHSHQQGPWNAHDTRPENATMVLHCGACETPSEFLVRLI